jgi:hypothetical protein
MSKPRRRPRRKVDAAMSLEQLDEWLQELEPPPLVDGVSMLDGYLTAVIVGPCSIPPDEWLDDALGPHGRLGFEGTRQSAAIMGIAARFMRSAKGWRKRRNVMRRSSSAMMTAWLMLPLGARAS